MAPLLLAGFVCAAGCGTPESSATPAPVTSDCDRLALLDAAVPAAQDLTGLVRQSAADDAIRTKAQQVLQATSAVVASFGSGDPMSPESSQIQTAAFDLAEPAGYLANMVAPAATSHASPDPASVAKTLDDLGQAIVEVQALTQQLSRSPAPGQPACGS